VPQFHPAGKKPPVEKGVSDQNPAKATGTKDVAIIQTFGARRLEVPYGKQNQQPV